MILAPTAKLPPFVFTITIAAGLFLPALAFSSNVFVQFDGSNSVQDPVYASASGAGYSAYADLQAGTFGAISSAPMGGSDMNAYAGISDPLVLTNIGATPLVLPLVLQSFKSTGPTRWADNPVRLRVRKRRVSSPQVRTRRPLPPREPIIWYFEMY